MWNRQKPAKLSVKEKLQSEDFLERKANPVGRKRSDMSSISSSLKAPTAPRTVGALGLEPGSVEHSTFQEYREHARKQSYNSNRKESMEQFLADQQIFSERMVSRSEALTRAEPEPVEVAEEGRQSAEGVQPREGERGGAGGGGEEEGADDGRHDEQGGEGVRA